MHECVSLELATDAHTLQYAHANMLKHSQNAHKLSTDAFLPAERSYFRHRAAAGIAGRDSLKNLPEEGAATTSSSLKKDPLVDDSIGGGFAARMQRPVCRVQGNEPTRVAVCFFGLIRNLDHSLSSIDSYLLQPTYQATSLLPRMCT